MNALDSRTIRTLILAAISYAFVKWAVPDHFASPVVKDALADIIVYVAFAAAAYYRKHAQGVIDRWWGRDA